jgi:hypothetical protein
LYRGNTVVFSKVLTIYHSWIHPLHHSPLSPSPHSSNRFNRPHCSIFTHEYTIFPSYSPSYTLSLYPPTPYTGTNPPEGHVLPSYSLVFENKRHFYLFKIYTGCFIVTFPYYYLNWFNPSIFLLSTSPSYGDLNRFKNSIFILV